MITLDENNVYIEKSQLDNFSDAIAFVEQLLEWCLQNNVTIPIIEKEATELIAIKGKDYRSSKYILYFPVPDIYDLDADNVV